LHGIDRKYDTLPEKFFNKPLRDGPTKGWRVEPDAFDETLNEYYRQCGWDEQSGNPTMSTLTRLGIDWVVDKSGLQ
jgi:aldehyde:ferredoxin oxidoreductase